MSTDNYTSPLSDLQTYIEQNHDKRIRELAEAAGVDALLNLPGVYEAAAEEYNNEAIAANRVAWCEDKGIDEDAPEAIEACSKLTRDDCIELLTDAGIKTYGDEHASTLRDAVEANVADGTIDPSDVLGRV